MSGAQRSAVVFAAAPVQSTPRLRARLSELSHPYVVAADRGAATALAFGYRPDIVIGDLDSIDTATQRDLLARQVPIEIHPRDKDATDGQLALKHVIEAHPQEILLLGFLGGPRLDQALANVLLLIDVRVPTVMLDEHNECWLVRPGTEHAWRPEPDEVVSLLPLISEVVGVKTSGLRWPLVGEQLRLGDTRGLSNEPTADAATVSITGGLLLVTRHFASEWRPTARV